MAGTAEQPHAHSSWLNLVERWLANLTQDALRRGSHRSTAELEHAIEDYIRAANSNATVLCNGDR